jgi:hypothetical protein
MSSISARRLLANLLEQIEASSQAMVRAKPGPAMEAAYRQALGTIRTMSAIAPEMNQELIAEFRAEYVRQGGTGPMPKNFVDKAYRNRQKAVASLNRQQANLERWATQLHDQTVVSKVSLPIRKEIGQLRFSKKPADVARVAELQKRLNGLPKVPDTPQTPTVLYDKGRKRGRVQYPADAYFKMVTDTTYNINRNMASAAASKNGWVIVSDGPQCGKTSHHDSEKVNGQTWPVQDAFKYPLAHPNCHRQFFPAAGPPGSKKNLEQRKALGLARTSKVKSTVKNVAKAASTVGIVMAVGNEIVINLFVQRFVREILSDVEIRMAPAVQRYLTRLTSYAAREQSAYQTFGQKIGATTQEEFNTLVHNSLDNDLANEEFLMKAGKDLINLRPEQARMLGLPQQVTKRALLERMDDYGDFLLHRDAMARNLAERLAHEGMVQGSKYDIYDSTAAINFQVERAPGVNLQRNWYRAIQHLQETYAKDPDRGNRELIRLGAAVFDPTPWMKVKLPANFRFSFGMTSEGRQDLAEKLYMHLTDATRMTETELRWAREFGLDLEAAAKKAREIRSPNSDYEWTKQDFIDAFKPRVTFQPGGMLHATISMEQGKIIPALRAYPPGVANRFAMLETKLRAGVVQDFIKTYDGFDGTVKEKLAAAIGELDSEDAITAVRLFRNSPLQVSLRMVGLTPESFSVKALPNNAFMRYSYRFHLESPSHRAMRRYIDGELAAGRDLKDIVNGMALHDKNADDVLKELRRRKALGQSETDAMLAIKSMDRFTIGAANPAERLRYKKVIDHVLSELSWASNASPDLAESVLAQSGLRNPKVSKIADEVQRLIRTGMGEQQALNEVGLIQTRQLATMMEDWKSGIHVLPRSQYGFTLNGFSFSQREALIRLKLAGNNLITIAKQTRYGYTELLGWWKQFRSEIESLRNLIDVPQYVKNHDFEGLGRAIHEAVSRTPSIANKNYNPDRYVALDFADERMLRNPVLANDLKKFRAVWEEVFPNVPVPEVKLSSSITNMMETHGGVIYLREDLLSSWGNTMRRKAVRSGYLPADTEDTVATLFHEGAHALMQTPEFAKYFQGALEEVFKAYKTWPKKIDLGDAPSHLSLVGRPTQVEGRIRRVRNLLRDPEMQKAIEARLSGYAGKSAREGKLDELIAEALSEYITSSNPRPIAKTVGEYYTKAIKAETSEFDLASDRLAGLRMSRRREINREIQDTVSGKLYQIADDPKLLERKLEAEKPQWWWVDDPGFEDLEIDKRIVDGSPEHVEDVKQAYLWWQEQGFKQPFPKVGTFHVLPGTDENAHGALAAYQSSTNAIYIPEVALENHGLMKELRKLLVDTGYTVEGTQASHFTIRHELGHYWHANLPNEMRLEVLELIQQEFESLGDLGFQSTLRRFIDGEVRDEIAHIASGNAPSLTPREMYRLEKDQLSFALMLSKHSKDLASEYGATNWPEFMAELFLRASMSTPSQTGNLAERLAWLIRSHNA